MAAVSVSRSVVGGHEGVRLGGEGDDADADLGREFGEEGLGRGLGGGEAGRRDVGRLHRTRHVDRQEDRRVLAWRGHDHGRAGQGDGQGRDGAEIDDRGHVPAPGGSAWGEVREQVQVREPDRVARPAALDQRGTARPAPARASRPRSRMGARKVMRFVQSGSRLRASASSQLPWVVSRMWRMPSRRNSAATAVRSAVGGLVEGGAEASVAGVDPQRSAALGIDEASARRRRRGVLARVDDLDGDHACADRRRPSASTASRCGPRKSDTIATSPAVVRDVATAWRARASVDAGRALLGRLGRERPEQPEHAVAAAGRRDDGLAAGAERDDAESVRAARHEAPDDQRGAFGHVGLAAIGGPEVHRCRGVEQQPRGELPVRHVLADLRAPGCAPSRSSRSGGRRRRPRTAGAGRGPARARARRRGGHRPSGRPTRRPRVTSSRRTRSSAIGPGPGRAGVRGAPEIRAEVGHAVGSTANSRRGAGTSVDDLAMTESGVTPSASAA